MNSKSSSSKIGEQTSEQASAKAEEKFCKIMDDLDEVVEYLESQGQHLYANRVFNLMAATYWMTTEHG